MKYPLKVEKFALLDEHDNELCICRFEKEYEKTMRLSGYFSNSKNDSNLQKIFRDIKYLGIIEVEQYEKLSTQDEVVQFSISTRDLITVEGKLILGCWNFCRLTYIGNFLSNYTLNYKELGI